MAPPGTVCGARYLLIVAFGPLAGNPARALGVPPRAFASSQAYPGGEGLRAARVSGTGWAERREMLWFTRRHD
jgi:hypothetical protein